MDFAERVINMDKKETMIKAKDLVYEYRKYDEEGRERELIKAVNGVNFQIEKGDFVAILGHNGSGKSTWQSISMPCLCPARELSGWMASTRRKRSASGMCARAPVWYSRIRTIRLSEPSWKRTWALVRRNMGVPTKEIWERVEESLKAVNMLKYRHHSPNKLSGGQKQRVAIAGVVAMHPECIVLDEPTAMLDPNGRKEVIRTVRALNEVEDITVILITHYMEEVIYADKVIVMDDGKIVMTGTPREIFSQVETLKSYRLDVPQATQLAWELKKAGLDLPDGILTREELVEALCHLN